MSLNNLLAAPGFAAWLSGEPLDVHSLLYTSTGRPRISIFYTAHLAEPERLFFTALLLNQTLGWMRRRPGTTSLRALLYIDELFGYLPPIGEPPTKRPLLTLLKQARAYGLGIVLATQNPVDLDYKGLSNIGTWFLGRLQTERDKERVLDGLEGAASGAEGAPDRAQLSAVLSALGHRVFLMHNVHEDAPVVFQSRWALSYLAGPMTRDQIRILMASKRAAATTAGAEQVPLKRSESRADEDLSASLLNERPVLPPDISELFLPTGTPVPPGEKLTYRPHLVARVQIHYVDSRKSISADEDLLLLTPLHDRPSGIDWSQAQELGIGMEALLTAPPAAGQYAELPAMATLAKSYVTWSKSLSDHLYRTRRYRLFTCEELRETSIPGEDEREFRLRLGDRAREERDRRAEELRARYASKLDSINNRIRMAAQRVEREKQEASGARMQSMISLGNTVLQMVLGRKKLSTTTMNRASTAARGASRAAQQEDDVQRAEENLEAYQDQLLELEEELQTELRLLEQRLHVLALRIDERPLKPRRRDVDVRRIALAWVAD
jgi:hypothetical protein